MNNKLTNVENLGDNSLNKLIEKALDITETNIKLKYINTGIDLGQVMFLDDSYRGVGKTTTVLAAAEKLALNPFNDVKIAVGGKTMARCFNEESGRDYYVHYDDLLERDHSKVLVLIDDLDMSAYKKLKLDCKIEIAGGVVNIEPKDKVEQTEYVLRMPMVMRSDATTWYVKSVFGDSPAATHPELGITTDLMWRAKRYSNVLDAKKAAKDTGTIACKIVTEKSYITVDL